VFLGCKTGEYSMIVLCESELLLIEETLEKGKDRWPFFEQWSGDVNVVDETDVQRRGEIVLGPINSIESNQRPRMPDYSPGAVAASGVELENLPTSWLFSIVRCKNLPTPDR
jgi:hypothetical protein